MLGFKPCLNNQTFSCNNVLAKQNEVRWLNEQTMYGQKLGKLSPQNDFYALSMKLRRCVFNWLPFPVRADCVDRRSLLREMLDGNVQCR